MVKVSVRNILKGLVRINSGFALVRCYSLDVVWPRKTSVHLGEWLYEKLRRK
ncbi:hypothetical protein [Thermococcus sp. 21S7]|uniref:hypothetical protein n=1 Tax=Thermococcus sp. 21S7 TaxID=1638221 RepID=UPI00143AADE5|nr:hypothetical protein [Thermococcus sp. 21S7]